MKIKKKVIKIGTSLGVIFDRVISRTLDLKAGEDIEIDIKKIKDEN